MWKARALTLEELLNRADISLPRPFSGIVWRREGGARARLRGSFHFIADPFMALVIGGVAGCVGLFANMPNAAKHTKLGQVVSLIEHDPTIPDISGLETAIGCRRTSLYVSGKGSDV